MINIIAAATSMFANLLRARSVEVCGNGNSGAGTLFSSRCRCCWARISRITLNDDYGIYEKDARTSTEVNGKEIRYSRMK